MNEETQQTATAQTAEQTVQTTGEKTSDVSVATDANKSKELESALAQKAHFREKLERSEQERKELEDRLNKMVSGGAKPTLEVEDFIDISASLEGLDGREKERLAREHKLTGRPLKEIRKDEDFVLWQKAYRDKKEKEELTLRPTGAQASEPKKKSFSESVREASLSDKEKMLIEKGLYRNPRSAPDRRRIGL